jgi:formamidopyrimidine-DNA glycosylase
VVAGVGNIYASESLFRACIHPLTPAQSLTLKQCATLVTCIRQTLTEAIAAGGSSLRDYVQSSGQLGYFQHAFKVYGRKGQPCLTCATPIAAQTITQRNTFWCPTCQPA